MRYKSKGCKIQFCLECGCVIRIKTHYRKRPLCGVECRERYFLRTHCKVCEQCGIMFFSESKGVKFCSCYCVGLSQMVYRGKCEVCGIRLKKQRKKYCSMGCRLSVYKKRVSSVCLNCGEVIYAAVERKYCNVSCMIEHRGSAGRKKYSINPKVRFSVLRRDNFRCYYCGRDKYDGIKLHIDHVIPRSLGGMDVADNLVCSCDECNIGKSDTCLTDYEKANLCKK